VKGQISGDIFTPNSAVLQKGGLPDGNLIKALLTTWSIVPHACLFRRKIVEESGGFPTDITGAEDQLMFLNCLLGGARVIHSANTINFYRVGNIKKLTSHGPAQLRMAQSWANYLLYANEEVGARYVCRSPRKPTPSNESETTEHSKQELVPANWFDFRLRCYEAHKDLEKFFPDAQDNLKAGLKRIHSPQFDASNPYRCRYELSGWWYRKLGGIRTRFGCSRAKSCFRARSYGEQDAALFPNDLI
jgi:hypothetical protein